MPTKTACCSRSAKGYGVPGSSGGGREEALDMILRIEPEPQRILDVGAGMGQWAKVLHPWFPDAHFEAVEIFRPYVERYNLEELYNKIHVCDVRNWFPASSFDLVVFGDVIEHLEKDDAMKVMDRLLTRYALISIPIGPCPQEGTEENPHEAHVAEWTSREIFDAFPVVDWFAYQYPPPHYGRGIFMLEKR